ncbi:serine protease [Alteromonas sp. ASW11-36]|uniref:Serine protease n=1 Tax=Alteromonas arenosi TaxID=3055817 RepID=A0ABT7SVS8_9ALTE|nr:serine protease [Alteromonas sp. ASW11-36]MDM7859652.1 serine protease [Alteromonas sp. ASW11-36]
MCKFTRISSYICACVLTLFITFNCWASELVDVIAKAKPSIVGVGVYAPLATVSHQLEGTGFVVGDGHYVVTNEHVINSELEEGIKSQRVIFVPNGRLMRTISIEAIYTDADADIAIVKIAEQLPALTLQAKDKISPDGSNILITGFPIGAVLGLFPATHQGIVAALTPNVRPAQHSSQITQQYLDRLQQPMLIYQLDITAYPGNSGSPVYLSTTGEVIAVINKVFVKQTKESAISDPSGITYAIPISFVHALAEKHNIQL